jgi:subtilisin-like proprotein convertase family protein
VDANRVANTVTLPSGDSYVPEPAWTQNGAGRWFDNWYGFGLVDGAAAVAAARSYTGYLTGQMRSNVLTALGEDCDDGPTAECGTEIPVGEAEGADFSVNNTDASIGTIEALQLTLAIGDSNLGDTAVELISPAGTRSVLLHAFTELLNNGSDVTNFVLATQAFNGESAAGNWTLRLIDVATRDAPAAGRFMAAKIQVFGH